MNSPQIKYEGWLYGLAFLIALAFRFIQLSAAPLTDTEARLALQAFHITQGQAPLLAPQAAYILFTSLGFVLIESTNFMARAIPALAGCALIFAPYFFRHKLGARPALILAFLFAIDPGLVALSRQASGTILAVTSLLFAWGMWINQNKRSAGVFFGLALLAGPSIWSGLLVLSLTGLFLRLMQPKPTADESPSEDRKSEIVHVLVPLIATLLLAGTLFFTVPNGLSAALASLPAYFSGWVTPVTTTTLGRTLLAFGAYELLGISLAGFALIRGFRTNSKRLLRLSLWLALALLLATFYRQTNELAWAVIPLLTLAALELSRAFDVYREEYLEVGVVITAIVILVVYVWFNVSNIALNPNQVPTTVPLLGVVQNPRYFVLIGSLLILVVSIGLVAFGWSARTARLGAIWSFVLFFGVHSIGAAWGASGLRYPGGMELWLPDSRPLQADLFSASMTELADMSRAQVTEQPVAIFGVSSPALEWLLRNYQVKEISTLDPQFAPPIVVTLLMSDLALPSAYRGQDFIWRQTPQWNAAQKPDWLKWFVFRQMPTDDEYIILWARDDLFPDARPATP